MSLQTLPNNEIHLIFMTIGEMIFIMKYISLKKVYIS